MVIVDRLTKMVHLRALKANAFAPVVARVFIDTVVALHGLPQTIVSDRDTRFTSAFWQQVTSLLGVKLYMSSGYHPETDGQTERVNRVIGELLRSRCRDKEDEWDSQLGMMEFAINSAKHPATGALLCTLHGLGLSSSSLGDPASLSEIPASGSLLQARAAQQRHALVEV